MSQLQDMSKPSGSNEQRRLTGEAAGLSLIVVLLAAALLLDHAQMQLAIERISNAPQEPATLLSATSPPCQQSEVRRVEFTESQVSLMNEYLARSSPNETAFCIYQQDDGGMNITLAPHILFSNESQIIFRCLSSNLIGNIHAHPNGVAWPSKEDLYQTLDLGVYCILYAPSNFTCYSLFYWDTGIIEDGTR